MFAHVCTCDLTHSAVEYPWHRSVNKTGNSSTDVIIDTGTIKYTGLHWMLGTEHRRFIIKNFAINMAFTYKLTVDNTYQTSVEIFKACCTVYIIIYVTNSLQLYIMVTQKYKVLPRLKTDRANARPPLYEVSTRWSKDNCRECTMWTKWRRFVC